MWWIVWWGRVRLRVGFVAVPAGGGGMRCRGARSLLGYWLLGLTSSPHPVASSFLLLLLSSGFHRPLLWAGLDWGPPGASRGGGRRMELLLQVWFPLPLLGGDGGSPPLGGILTPLLRGEEAGFLGGDPQDTGGVRCRLGAAALLSSGFGQRRGWAPGAWFGLGSLSGSRQPDCLALASRSPVSEGWGG